MKRIILALAAATAVTATTACEYVGRAPDGRPIYRLTETEQVELLPGIRYDRKVWRADPLEASAVCRSWGGESELRYLQLADAVCVDVKR